MYSYAKIAGNGSDDDDEPEGVAGTRGAAGSAGGVVTGPGSNNPGHKPTQSMSLVADSSDPFDQLVLDRHGSRLERGASTSVLDDAHHAEAVGSSGNGGGGEATTAGGEQGTDVGGRRELHIWAVPLYRCPDPVDAAVGNGAGIGSGGSSNEAGPVQSLVFLPVKTWKNPEKELQGVKSAIRDKARAFKDKAQTQWHEMGEKEAGTFSKRVHNLGKRVQESMSPEERLTSAIPKNVSKIIIRHPTPVGPDLIMEKLQSTTSRYGTMSALKAGAAAVVLPLALGMDMLVIPGPFTTSFVSYHLYTNSKSAVGSKRLAGYITQDGAASDVRVNYCPDPRLDPFFDMAQDSADGCLGESEIEALVEAVRQEELATPLLELRARHLRASATTKGRDDHGRYALLPTSGK